MAIKLDRLAGNSFNNNMVNVESLAQQVAQSVKVSYFVADDNLVSWYGTRWENLKEVRFIKKDIEMPSGEIRVKSETMSTLGTTDIGFFFDNEINPKIILNTIGTVFELLEGTVYIGNLLEGIHSIKIGLQNLYRGTSFQRLLEIHSI